MVTQMTIWSIIMLVATNMFQSCITDTAPEAFGMPSCSHCIDNPPENRLLASAAATAPLLHPRRQRLLLLLRSRLVIFPVDTEGERRNNWWCRWHRTFLLLLSDSYTYRRNFWGSRRLSRGCDVLLRGTIISSTLHADLWDSGGYYDLRMRGGLVFIFRV